MKPLTSGYDNNLVDAIEESSYLESERGKVNGRDNSTDRDPGQDAEKSWYLRGYAIERMSFLLRGGEDVTKNTVCDGNDSESDAADSVEGGGRDDSEEFNSSHGGFLLDKSLSHPVPHGGTWSNSAVRKEEGRNVRHIVNQTHDFLPSSDPTQDGARGRKGIQKPFQNVTSISFNGPYDSRPDGTGEDLAAAERGVCTLPLVNTHKRGVQCFEAPGTLLTLAARPSLTKQSDPVDQGHGSVQRHAGSGDANRHGRVSSQTDGSGTGCTMN